jgi:hypothetical protein
MPTVKALSSQSRPSMIGISRPTKLPGPSKISCVWPWSAAACECDALSCEWLCDMMVRVLKKQRGWCDKVERVQCIREGHVSSM